MLKAKGKLEAADGGGHGQVVERLLAAPSVEAIRRHYGNLACSGIGGGLEVRYIGGEKGKGVFASRSFAEEEVVLREPKLVGAQHTENKMDALNCSFCLRYIGSLELQIGRRLKLMAECEQGVPNGDVHSGHWHGEVHGAQSDDESSEARKTVPGELVEALLNGGLELPYSRMFPLPPVDKCCGGCLEELYCSLSCAEAAWEDYHMLLCAGPKSLCSNQEALEQFRQHADSTNDIFHVAAQVVAQTVLRARKIRQQKPAIGVDAALLEGWEPFAMGFKGLWWEVVALPEDVDPAGEADFRSSIKRLAAASLSLLKEAIFVGEFEPLFTLEVYGHIVGMFELNNLEIVVRSPLEDYFIFIDELPPSSKVEAEKVTRPFFEALGDGYADYCEGTGFFSLQSCMNHSCVPNAKAFKRDVDTDGQAVLLATRDISEGEEITISYIDDQLPFYERQAALADYGFECKCERCCREEVREAERNDRDASETHME